MSRFGAKSSSVLLEKVNRKLRGETPKTEDDDGLQAYLSGLGKTSKVTTVKKSDFQWDKFGEASEPSLSEDEPMKKAETKGFGTSGSKFLKKKQPEQNKQDGVKKGFQSGQKSAALSKVSGFSTKYTSKAGVRQEAVRLSGSDVDFSFSVDGQILGDVESLTPAITPRHEKSFSEESSTFGKKGSRFMKKPSKVEEQHAPLRQSSVVEKPKAAAPQHKPSPSNIQGKAAMTGMDGAVNKQQKIPPSSSGVSGSQKPMTTTTTQWPSLQQNKKPVTFDVDEESSSMSIGKGGSKFMKKKQNATEKKPVVSPVQSPKEKRKKRREVTTETPKQEKKSRDLFTLRTSEKYGTSVRLDSDEESLQGFIQDLASTHSDVSMKSPPKSPKTPRGILKTPRTPHSATTLEDIHEEKGNTTLSDEDSFKINILDFDALGPAELSPPEVKLGKSKKAQEKSSKTTTKDATKKKQDNKKISSDKKSKSKSIKSKKQKSRSFETDDDVFAELGLFTVEDLLGRQRMSDSDDIGTDIEREAEDDSRGGYGDRSPSPLRSILSPSPKLDRTPRSSRTRVHYSLEDDDLAGRTRSPSPEVISTARGSAKSASVIYTDDFDDARSDIRTEDASEMESVSERLGYSQSSYTAGGGGGWGKSKRRSESEYYSDDFISATESRWSEKRREYAVSRSESAADSEYSAYSDTFSEMSDSRTDTLGTRKNRRSRGNEKEVQTGHSLADLTYKWQPDQSGVAYVTPGYGLQNMDPKLVATHVVSADALEAMTSYSPSVLALNEMLRQQLQITEDYINVQKTLYQSLLNTTHRDYVYTTLEDTKQYIKKHRKPKLTFDEALRQVKQEMGLDK